MRTDRLIATYDIEPRYVMFPLHPETPEEGMSLLDLFGGNQAYVDASRARLTSLMEAEGLRFAHRTHTYNSRLAQELGKWAERQPDGERIHDALYRAYFVDGVNLAEVDALVRVAESCDFSGQDARGILETRAEREAVDRDWLHSREIGVTGVPTFVAGGRAVVGAQPYEMLEALVTRAGASSRIVSSEQ